MSSITIVNTDAGTMNRFIPTGCLSLISAVEEEGYSVDFKDYQLYKGKKKPSPHTFYRFIRDTGSILGLSVICNSLPTVLLAVQKLKEERPDKTVILGGPSATDTPTEIMEHFPVDIIVIGEGEETIVEVMEALDGEKELKDVAGIAYRDNGRIVVNPRRKRIENLDSLPFPAYHKIDFRDYEPTGIISLSRGCSLNCSFCSASHFWGRSTVERSVENIIQELLLIEKNLENVFLSYYPTKNGDKNIQMFCNEIKKEKIDLSLGSRGVIGLGSQNLLKTISTVGWWKLHYSVVSGSNNVLRRINKPFTAQEAIDVVKKSAIFAQKIEVSLIWGFPFATIEEFYDTVLCFTALMTIPNVEISLTLLSPIPSSPLYREYSYLLRFDKNFISKLTSPLGDVLFNYPELVELVQCYPSVFSSYHYFDHQHFKRKTQIIKKLIEKKREMFRDIEIGETVRGGKECQISA